MSKNKSKDPRSTGAPKKRKDTPSAPGILDVSRRSILAGLTVGSVTAAGLGFALRGDAKAGSRHGHDGGHGGPPKKDKKHKKDRILLKGGVVLTLDPDGQDYEKADVLVEGEKIVAIGPNIHAHAKVVDCSGLIVMPGFVTTHHHQYETVQRAIISDGLINFNFPGGVQPGEQQTNAWPYESYSTVVQNIWTSGAFTDDNGDPWDLGEAPQHPEDLYISELVASLAQITQGITCATDTSQASHTPQHTDAMIKGLMDSGARALFDYSNGFSRAAPGDVSPTGYEHPGKKDVTSWGVGRLVDEYFSSSDQLVTLGLNANQADQPDRSSIAGAMLGYSGWELARHFGLWINNHAVNASAVADGGAGAALLDDPNNDIGEHLTLVHAVRWQDGNSAQIGPNKTGFPDPATSVAMQRAADTGVHISIACPLEMQMRHGMPPIQNCLNHGIMPSLSPDVDTNQSSDPFTLMRGAFNLQRGLANDLAYPQSDGGGLIVPQLLTCYQVLQMATHAGAVGSGLGGKVGKLKVGYEADIVFLETNSIDIAPMNNAPGSVVTMMDTSHVRHVMIAGEFKYWDYELVGWKVDKLIRDINRSRDKMLERIRAVPMPQPGKNSPNPGGPYRPNFLGSCCYVGQNENAGAPEYVLRP
jgi:cytosine/adenosine deaminase-related metal-dependent hydrolase